MSSEYKVIINDHSGAKIAEIAGEGSALRSLSYSHVVNGIGACHLVLDGTLPLTMDFISDYIIEIHRRNLEMGLEWYKEWEGFGVDPDNRITSGNDTFEIAGVTFSDMLKRAKILYRAETPFVDKSGVGETVMKAFVNENIGPGVVPADILFNQQMYGLVIEPNQGRGLSWEGSRAWRKLYDTVAEIALSTGLYFDIVRTGPVTFEFRVYSGQRGQDRTDNLYDDLTGLNSSDNAPLVFSTDFENMANPHYRLNRSGEINTVIVLGEGNEASRKIQPRTDDLARQISPWNIRVETYQASQQTSYTALSLLGDAVLMANKAEETIDFDVIQQPSSFYGKHYSWGDQVIVRFKDKKWYKHINKVTVEVAGDEQISVEFGDAPG